MEDKLIFFQQATSSFSVLGTLVCEDVTSAPARPDMARAVCACVCEHILCSTLGSLYFIALTEFCISPHFCKSTTVCVLMCCVVCALLWRLYTGVLYATSKAAVVVFSIAFIRVIAERNNSIRFPHRSAKRQERTDLKSNRTPVPILA